MYAHRARPMDVIMPPAWQKPGLQKALLLAEPSWLKTRTSCPYVPCRSRSGPWRGTAASPTPDPAACWAGELCPKPPARTCNRQGGRQGDGCHRPRNCWGWSGLEKCGATGAAVHTTAAAAGGLDGTVSLAQPTPAPQCIQAQSLLEGSTLPPVMPQIRYINPPPQGLLPTLHKAMMASVLLLCISRLLPTDLPCLVPTPRPTPHASTHPST